MTSMVVPDQTHVLDLLYLASARRSCRLLVLRQGLRPLVRGLTMDYIIAGIAAVLLFGYLIYALLRPERF